MGYRTLCDTRCGVPTLPRAAVVYSVVSAVVVGRFAVSWASVRSTPKWVQR